MKDPISSPTTAPPADPARRSLVADVRELADAGKQLASAEIAYQRGRATYAGKSAGAIAALAGLALLLVFLALLALVVGLLLTLAPILTPIGATAAVCAGLGIAAIFCAMVGVNRWRRMIEVLREPGEDDA
jgi:uncharacterized membrane protein YqjE